MRNAQESSDGGDEESFSEQLEVASCQMIEGAACNRRELARQMNG